MLKKYILFLPCILLFINFFGCSQKSEKIDYSRDEYLEKFEQRRAWMVAQFDTLTRDNYSGIAAHYYSNKDVEWADQAFINLLKAPKGAMFWMFPVVNCYMHGKGKMSNEVEKAVRHAWKTYAPARGDTENHWAMWYTCMLIMSEQWPDLPGSEWFDGKSSKENFDEAKEYLFEWARITTTIGQGEFDSPDYILEYIIPTTMLYEFAQDPEVKKLGEMMTDYILADFAVEHFSQQYVGGHSRIYERALMNFTKSAGAMFANLYFGVGEQIKHGWVLYPAMTSYKLPEIIYYIARDRSEPYIHKERKRVRNVIRYGTERNLAVYKYSYLTKDYGIGSLMGGILQPIQQLTWNVRFTHGKPYSMIFGLHPSWSLQEIGMFFPEPVKTSMAGITASKTTYNNPDKWTGGSPCERTFQHKNTLLALYDIPVGATANHIDGFFPANLEERIIDDSGWIICKAGDVYIGWYPLQPGEWTEEFEVKKQAFNSLTSAKKNDGTMTLRNYRFRSHALQNGYVVEVRSKDEMGSFKDFKKKLATNIPQAVLKENNVQVSYTTLNNDKMKFSFPDGRVLNGKNVDLTKTPLFQGPFLNAEVGSQNLTLTYKDQKMVLDFKNLEITNY